MRKSSLLFWIVLLCSVGQAPLRAQHTYPANTSFSMYGNLMFETPGGVMLNCPYSVQGTTRTDVGGMHSGHATGGAISSHGLGTPDPLCAFFPTGTILSSTGFDILTYAPMGLGVGTGQFTDINIVGCGPSASIPFTITNYGIGRSTVQVSGAVGSCFIEGALDTDLFIVP